MIYWVITFFLEKLISRLEKSFEVPAEVPERDAEGKIIRGKRAAALARAAVKTEGASGAGEAER